jgi:hypothetical protein
MSDPTTRTEVADLLDRALAALDTDLEACDTQEINLRDDLDQLIAHRDHLRGVRNDLHQTRTTLTGPTTAVVEVPVTYTVDKRPTTDTRTIEDVVHDLKTIGKKAGIKTPPSYPTPAAEVAGTDRRAEASRARAAQRASCDRCGREFSLSGLGPHRKRCNPLPNTVANTKPEPRPPSTSSQITPIGRPANTVANTPARPIGGKVLACEGPDCDFETSLDRVGALRNHIISVHGRPIRDSERIPVPAINPVEATA